MEYVMVPVPEEHAEAVTRYLQKVAQTARPDGRLGPGCHRAVLRRRSTNRRRSLLLLVADASVRGVVLTVQSAAEAAGCSSNEVLGMTVALNDAVLAAGGPWFLLAAMPSPAETGQRSWSLKMGALTVARAVVELYDEAQRGGEG